MIEPKGFYLSNSQLCYLDKNKNTIDPKLYNLIIDLHNISIREFNKLFDKDA